MSMVTFASSRDLVAPVNDKFHFTRKLWATADGMHFLFHSQAVHWIRQCGFDCLKAYRSQCYHQCPT